MRLFKRDKPAPPADLSKTLEDAKTQLEIAKVNVELDKIQGEGDKEAHRMRLTAKMNALLDDLKQVIASKDGVIRALRTEIKALKETYGDMETEGLVNTNIPYRGTGLVDALVEYVKATEDIPKIAKGPVVEWIMSRKPQLEAMANEWLDKALGDAKEKALSPQPPNADLR